MKTFYDITALKPPPPKTNYAPRINATLAELTKPPGSLGRLEELVVWLGNWQQTHRPTVDRLGVFIFVGNHGVAARTSIFPPQVTLQMADNFKNGGAVINQLARLAAAETKIELIADGRATADFTERAAMSEAECVAAFSRGFDAVRNSSLDLICLGEMGIGNTAAAAALSAALFGGDGERWVGSGAGATAKSLKTKTATINAALSLHREAGLSPLEALRRLGGFELAALVGAIVAARLKPTAVVLDGVTVAAAAGVAHRLLGEGGLDHCLAGHLSAERSHARLLKLLGLSPLLNLKMRLGEGSGAVLAAMVVKSAVEVYNRTHTFERAQVTSRRKNES